MCCVSKKDPAVVYHKPYGLVLSGEVKVVFDHDSGISMLPNGTYPRESCYKFAHEVDLQTLMTSWYDQFPQSSNFIWNEVVFKKGSKIVGAFHDLSFDPETLFGLGDCTLKEQEYAYFLDKVGQLGLDLCEINAKFK